LAFALTLSELAHKIDGHIIRGGLDLSLTGMAALDAAAAGDVSFLGNEKYYPQFLTTRASAVIVPLGITDGPPDTALIAVANPSLAFSNVVSHFAATSRKLQPGIHPSAFVDPSAVLDPTQVRVQPGAVILAGAIIGNGSDIGPNSVIGEEVKIGQDCRIFANVSIRERCLIGDRVILQPGAIIGSDGYGYEFSEGRHLKIDQVGIVEIGNDVEVGANTTIDRARFGKTVIGEGTKIDNLVQIGHNVIVGKHCLIVSQTGIAGSSQIGDYVTMGGQCGVAGHLKIGDHSILAARAGVTISIAGNQAYSGRPAIPIREDMKFQALIRRLPKLVARVKALEDKLGEIS